MKKEIYLDVNFHSEKHYHEATSKPIWTLFHRLYKYNLKEMYNYFRFIT